MRRLTLLSTILLFSGCGGDQVNDNPLPVEESANATTPSSNTTTAVSTSATKTPPAPTARLPFDMPIMPGARYLSGLDFSKPSKRRGPEAIATIIAKGTTLEVVKFYETALTEHGFTAAVGRHNTASTATVRGVRENGETFTVTSMRGGSKAGDGECQTAIIATKPKPEDSE